MRCTQNARETQAAVHIARRFQREKKSYKIITPYDAQRAELENALKNAKLDWEDKVFNVDSFQGAANFSI
jgi:superfamily I DNA and/or RNA helicase